MHPLIQPVISTALGFIPNCAISIILVQLYMVGGLTFGSMIAGLCSGAGFIVVLMGSIMTMPGLAKNSAYLNMDIDNNGNIKGLF